MATDTTVESQKLSEAEPNEAQQLIIGQWLDLDLREQEIREDIARLKSYREDTKENRDADAKAATLALAERPPRVLAPVRYLSAEEDTTIDLLYKKIDGYDTKTVDAKGKELKTHTDGITDQKNVLEEECRRQFKCPVNGLFMRFRAHIERYKADQLVARGAAESATPETERDQFKTNLEAEGVKAGPAFFAHALCDANLLPSDLKGGANVAAAARVTLPGPIGADLGNRLEKPDAPGYAAALQEFNGMVDAVAVQPYFDAEVQMKTGAEQLETGVAVGHLAKLAQEIGKNPVALVGSIALVAFLAIGGIWKGSKLLGDGQKSVITRILGAIGFGGGLVALVGGASYLVDKGSSANLGIADRLESALGMRMDDALAPEALKNVRHYFDGMKTKDTDAVDDAIRISDASMEDVISMFDASVRSHSTEVNSRMLINKGLDEKEFKSADDGSIRTACAWFFMDCYNTGVKEGKIQPGKDETEKLQLGLEWASKEFAGHAFGTAVIALEVVKGVNAGKKVPLTPGAAPGENAAMDPNLNKLLGKEDMFDAAFRSTPVAGVYLIKGYAYRYDYVDKGSHRFIPLLGTSDDAFVVDKALEGEPLEATLRRFVTEVAEVKAKDKLAKIEVTPAVTGSSSSAAKTVDKEKLRYNNGGYWELEPKLERNAHAGLPNYLMGPNDPKVPVIFYADPSDGKMCIGLDANPKDGKPDPRETPYNNVAEVANEFEKNMLHDLVARDLEHTMLVDFTVGDIEETPASAPALGSTKITIKFGTTGKGTIIYEGGVLKVGTGTGDSRIDNGDAELGKKWTAAAGKEVTEFLGLRRVQNELLRVTGDFTGLDSSLLSGLMNKAIEIYQSGRAWVENDSIQNKFEHSWEKQVVQKMINLIDDPVNGLAKKYVDEMLKKIHKPDDWQGDEDKFFNDQLTAIAGTSVIMAPIVPETTPDMPLQGNELNATLASDGDTAITEALAPLKNQTPSLSASISGRLFRAGVNFATGDSARNTLYEARKEYYQKELANACRALTPPTRDTVKNQIEIIRGRAETEATSYWGTTDNAAIEALMLEPIKDKLASGVNPGWKAPTELVARYLANNFKWENYGILPNPENMEAIMKIWYAKIDQAKLSSSGLPVDPVVAMQYAREYFLPQVYVFLGNNHDLSITSLTTSTIHTVSNDRFQGAIGSVGSIDTFDTWNDPRYVKVPLPVPPGLESATEVLAQQYAKEKAEAQSKFMEWFDKAEDPATVLRWDGNWPALYRAHVEARLTQVIWTPDTVAPFRTLQERLDLLQGYIANEKAIYSLLILSDVSPDRQEIIGVVNDIYIKSWPAREPAGDYGIKVFNEYRAKYPTMQTNNQAMQAKIDYYKQNWDKIKTFLPIIIRNIL